MAKINETSLIRISPEVKKDYDFYISMVKRCVRKIPEDERTRTSSTLWLHSESLLLTLKGFSQKDSVTVVDLFRSSYAAILSNQYDLYEREMNHPENPDGQLRDMWSMFLDCVENEVNDHLLRLSELSSLFKIILTEEELQYERLKYRAICLVGAVIDQWKYTANYVFLRHFGFSEEYVPLPSKPCYLGMRLFPRRLRVKIQRMNNKLSDTKNHQLIYTIFQGYKKGLLAVRPEKVVSNLLDHGEVLGTSKGDISDEMIEAVERTAMEVISAKSGRVIPSSFSANNCISSKSTIESNFSDHGALGQLLREASCTESRLSHEFFGYLEVGPSWTDKIEIKGPWWTNYELGLLAQSHIISSLTEDPYSKPACILEPMKVRIITKPKWNQYLGMKDIQKRWWRILQQTRCFELIGRPVNLNDIRWVGSRRDRDLDLFVSGDYSAATDNLKMVVTRAILKEIVSSQDLEIHTMCENALVNGKIIYDLGKVIPECKFKTIFGGSKDRGTENTLRRCLFGLDCFKERIAKLEKCDSSAIKGQFIVNQLNGQFMGSIISFIVLCIANLAAYRFAYETFHKTYVTIDQLMEDQPVLINGDDILFCCGPEFYTHWKKVISEFGFIPSPGKNLFHKDFCQINSVLFRIQDNENIPGRDAIDEICYVNFGMLTNRRKQECETDTSGQSLIGEETQKSLFNRMRTVKKIQSSLLNGLHPSLLEPTNRIFWNHQEWIRSVLPGLNPFLREEDGGLGLNDSGIDELEESRSEHLNRVRFTRFLQTKRKTTCSYLFPRGMSGNVAKIAEKYGNYFPSLRFGDEQSDDGVGCESPVNLFWRAIKWAKSTERQRRLGKCPDESSLEVYTLIEKPEKEIRDCIRFERIERFSRMVPVERLMINRLNYINTYANPFKKERIVSWDGQGA